MSATASNTRPSSWVWPLLAGLLVLFVWAIAWFSRLLDPFLFPSPWAVFLRLAELSAQSGFQSDLMQTLSKIIESILAGSALGLLIGFFASRWPLLAKLSSPLLDVFRSIPATALFPLFLLVLGGVDSANLGLAIWICALYIGFYTLQGLAISRPLRSFGMRELGASPTDIFWRVQLPQALPLIFVGFRTAVSLTLVVVILAEMFVGSAGGLGKLMIDLAYSYDIPGLYAILVVIGALGFLLNFAVASLGERLIHWQ